MTAFFEERDGSLIFRENGETVMVTPWGTDSLRVRAVFLGEIEAGSAALLEPDNTGRDVRIEIGQWEASITNGGIRAVLKVSGWGRALQTAFYNQK